MVKVRMLNGPYHNQMFELNYIVSDVTVTIRKLVEEVPVRVVDLEALDD